MEFRDILEEAPVIAAISNDEELSVALESDCKIFLIIHSTLQNVRNLVERTRENGRIAIVHADLVAGLSSKEIAVEYLLDQTNADGIVSTKPTLVKKSKDMGKYGILRAFIIDSSALETTKKQILTIRPDAVELMPGIIPRIFTEIKEWGDVTVIAAGLIRDRKDVMMAFDAGVDGVSATNQKIWFM